MSYETEQLESGAKIRVVSLNGLISPDQSIRLVRAEGLDEKVLPRILAKFDTSVLDGWVPYPYYLMIDTMNGHLANKDEVSPPTAKWVEETFMGGLARKVLVQMYPEYSPSPFLGTPAPPED